MKMKMCTYVCVVLVVSMMLGASMSSAESKTKSVKMEDVTFNVIENDDGDAFGLSAETMSMATAGSWSDSEVGPTIYQKGYWRFSPNFTPPAMPPSNATITYLSWQWSVVNYPYGLIVYVCDSNLNGCWDVSNMGIGGTTAFNGWPASTNFIMAFGVPGSGTIIPYVYGQSDTMNVSWSN